MKKIFLILFLCGCENTITDNSSENTANHRIVINEINYHSPFDSNSEDWVELYNPTNETIDISTWKFYGDDAMFIIPENTILLPNQYIVLSAKFNSDNMISDILTLIEKTKKNIKDKIKREPIGYSFGSTFKNNQIPAWRCIKEIRKSLDCDKGAFFSEKHSNWIINKSSSGDDIYSLIKQAQKLAKKKLDIDLEREVKII